MSYGEHYLQGERRPVGGTPSTSEIMIQDALFSRMRAGNNWTKIRPSPFSMRALKICWRESPISRWIFACIKYLALWRSYIIVVDEEFYDNHVPSSLFHLLTSPCNVIVHQRVQVVTMVDAARLSSLESYTKLLAANPCPIFAVWFADRQNLVDLFFHCILCSLSGQRYYLLHTSFE